MTLQHTNLDRVIGSTMYGADGEKIGSVGQVYLDDYTNQPEWVTVRTGLFGTKESFVPLADADIDQQGGLRVPYRKDTIKDAPNVDVEQGHLSEAEEARLFRHYGRSYGEQPYTTETGEGLATGTVAEGQRPVAGDDTQASTDEAMTRSEEQLRVGTEAHETGRARLRKYITTEQQTVTVPVTREEVRVEREPITEANRDAALSGPELSEAEHEVVLHEEHVVVDKQAVPVERVRLGTETVTEDRQVEEEVRKERIEAEGAPEIDDPDVGR